MSATILDRSNARRGLVRTGFTLIELLVVISIIALLIAILLPSLSKAREAAWAAVCMSNQRQVGISIHAYAAENDGYGLKPYSNYGPTFNGGWPHKQRYWPDVLMQGNYLPNNAVFEGKDQGAVVVSAIPDDSVLGCPTSPLVDTPTNVGSGLTLPGYGVRRASTVTFGMRQVYAEGGWQWYPGEKTLDHTLNGVAMRLPVLDSLKTDVPYVVDATNKTFSSPRDYFLFNLGNGTTPNNETIYRRHDDGANTWYPDGSGRRLTEDGVEDLPKFRSWTSSTEYKVTSWPQ